MAVYPLNSVSKGRDVSGRKNPPAIFGSVRPAPGPDRKQGSSYQFFGRPNSFIQLPNKGLLDTVNSITISLWVYPQGPGPLVNYNPRGQGMQIWMVSRTQLYARFVRRRGRLLTKPIIYRIYRRSWSYVAVTYNQKTGEARLYVNTRLVKRRTVGKYRLATNYPVRLGAKIGGTRFFKGRLACLQFYNTALSERQIAVRKRMCFKTRGKTSLPEMELIFISSLKLQRPGKPAILIIRAPVFRKLDSVIHRINHCPVEKCPGNPLRYPADSGLSTG